MWYFDRFGGEFFPPFLHVYVCTHQAMGRHYGWCVTGCVITDWKDDEAIKCRILFDSFSLLFPLISRPATNGFRIGMDVRMHACTLYYIHSMQTCRHHQSVVCCVSLYSVSGALAVTCVAFTLRTTVENFTSIHF